MDERIDKMRGKLLTGLGIVLLGVLALAWTVMAQEADIRVTGSDGYDTGFMLDDDFQTADYYHTDDTLTVTCDGGMDSLYIMWDTEPGEWILTVDGKEQTCGQHDFLHEFVELPAGTKEAVITIKKDRTYINELRAFTGTVPSYVQKWQEPCEKADMLVISTHSDDEILFLGGAIAIAADREIYDIQVAYYCDFTLTGEPYRRHELLNGIWAEGVVHYPQFGRFRDEYSEDLDTAKSQVDYDEVVGYMVETIRRFRPQVVVTQDFEGEYGHGQHRLVAAAVADAIEVTADSGKYPESVSKYGTWDVPKTYYHLYGENQIKLDVRTPLAHFGGRTALDVAKAAYLEHRSQQWMWFHVSDGIDDEVPPPDGYAYSPITDFGLYRTLVGPDTGNDMMENITAYSLQDVEPATAEPGTGGSEGETQQQTTAAGDGSTDGQGGSGEGHSASRLILTILIIVAVIIVILIIVIIILYIISRNKKKKREEERRKRIAAQRRRQAEMERSARRSSLPSGRPQTSQQSAARSSRVKEIKDIK